MLNIDSFLETALWSTTDFNNENLDSKYSADDVSEEFKAKCEEVFKQFEEKAWHLFTDEEVENSPIEHDLWLTIHGHGAGFWDGDYVNGDELTEICKQLMSLEDDLRDDFLE